MTLWGFLAAAVGPLAIKILIALGISAVTFVGVDTVSAQLIGYVTSGYSGLPVATLQIFGLAGVGQGLGLILGAFNARLALWLFASATKWITAPAA